jgi:hypothetical protein
MKGLGLGESRAKGLWVAARRTALAVATAAVIVLIGSRVNPGGVGTPGPESLDPVLLRRIDKAAIDVRTTIHAAKSLRQASGLWVTVDTVPTGPRFDTIEPEPVEPLRVNDRPLGWVLGRVLAQFDSAGDFAVSYIVEGDAIRLTYAIQSDLEDPLLVRAYDVSDHLKPYDGRALSGGAAEDDQTNARQLAGDLLVTTILETIMPTNWATAGGHPGWGVRLWGDRLIVTAPGRVQHAVGRFLFLLRHPAPLGVRSTSEAGP